MTIITNEQAISDLQSVGNPTSGFVAQPDRTGKVVTSVSALEPELTDIVPAAFRQENMIMSAIAGGNQSFPFDDSYNYKNDLYGYEDYESILAVSGSASQTNFLKEKIDQEKADRDILSRGGYKAVVSQLVAGVLDPTILIPVGGAGLKVARGLKAVGEIAKVSTAVAGTVAVQEAGLQATQLLRTKEESINAVLGGAIFAGAIGAGGYSLLRAKDKLTFDKIKKGVTQDIASEGNIPLKDLIIKHNGDLAKIEDELKSVGSAQVAGVDVAKSIKEAREYRLAGETIKGALGAEKVLKRMSPLLSTLQSNLVSSRDIIQKLLNNPLRMVKNAKFEETEQAVEMLREQYSVNALNAQAKVTNLYKQYASRVTEGKIPLTRENIIANAKAKITGEPITTSFVEEVGKALRRNEIHPIPEVAQSAQEYREFFNDVGQEAIKAGIWKSFPNRKTAESYFSRMFDHNMVEENLDEFTAIVKDWISKETENSVARLKQKANKQIENINNQISEIDVNKFRKASFLQEQAGAGAKDADLTIEDIKSLLTALGTGKPRKPKSLLGYIQDNGGLDKNDFNIADINIDNIKDWQRKNPFKGALLKDKEQGGVSLDDVGQHLLDIGFFKERPSVSEVVDFINDDASGFTKVLPEDEMALADYKYFEELQSIVDRVGINPKEYKGGKILLENPKMKEIRDLIIKASDIRANEQIKYLEGKKSKILNKLEDDLQPIVEMGIDDYADEVTEGIVGNIRGLDKVSPELSFDVATRGPLKEQKFLIPDEQIEKFLISDANIIAERYARTMGTDIELTNKFGSAKLEDVIAPITREFKQAEKGMGATERKKLKADYDRDIKNIEAVHQLLKGTYAGTLYSNPDVWYKKLGRVAMAYNYVRMLGGVTLSSIPDISRQIGYNGFGKFFSQGLTPFLKKIPQIVKGMRPIELEELKLAGVTIEHLNNARAMSMGDMVSRHGKESAMEKYIDATTKVFSRSTGLIEWNNMMQAIGGIMSQKRLSRNILDFASTSKLEPKEVEFMSFLGFSKKDMVEMAGQIKKYGKKQDDGFISVNTDMWDNFTLRKKFRTALRKDVQSIVLVKNLGDTPLFANTGIGKILLQFKSFVFASTTKTLLTGLQIRDSAQLQALASFIALGALSYVIKEINRGAEPNLEPNNLVYQGLDRSGVLGIFMEANNIFEKTTGIGLGAVTGKQGASRYASRSLDEALLGPSLGTISNLGQAAYALSPAGGGELTDSDKKNLRRLTPFNNLFYVQAVMARANKKTASEFGY
jgi:hypothetical protein